MVLLIYILPGWCCISPSEGNNWLGVSDVMNGVSAVRFPREASSHIIFYLQIDFDIWHQNPIYPNKIQFILTKSIIIQCKLIWTYSTFIAFYRLLTLYSNCKLILISSPLHQNPIYPNKIYYNLTANWFGHKVFCIKIQYIPTKSIIFQLQIHFDI